MALAFLAALGAQMGSAWYNSSRNKAHNEYLAELQRAYEEKATLEGIDKARDEFAKLCSFQREIEKELHLDRLKLIIENHEKSIRDIAYEKSLQKWPLLVPPYVIANAPVTLEASAEQCIPLNCIITTSANINFNLKVFPKLEEQLAIFCSKYWNVSANKSIRFFQEAWRDTTSDIGSLHKDIYAHLKSVPTLLISPKLKNDTILFQFYWWGLSSDPNDSHIDELNELNPQLSIQVTPDMTFDEETANLIVNECEPILEAFISFFADMYYWNYYKIIPSLPTLINESKININSNNRLCIQIKDAFLKEFEDDKSFSYDIHKNLIYLSEVKRIATSDSNFIEPVLSRYISRFLNIDTSNNDITLIDLITKHDLYSYIDDSDKEIFDNIIQNNMRNSKQEYSDREVIMDSNEYLVHKEELLKLLKDVQQISFLPKENLNDFQQIERKIQEDQFRIALIGEYQGGKSTTFDALCGGREISPRGNNIKTSSCKITALNICGEEKEYASVVWKNDVELIKTMSPILKNIEPEDIGYEPSENEISSSYYEYFDLKNPSHRNIIEDTIEELDSDSLSDELKDIILIAKFILTFYDETKEIRSRNIFTIEEASRLMTFPQKMVERYNISNGNVSVFDENEALFAFVQTVYCHIHSDQLGEIGSSFIDCPGLFVSDYDTSIAFETINTSDAVLYLLNGEKQIGQGDIRAIRTIFKNQSLGNTFFKGDNIFFAINQRKPDSQTSFVNLDLSQINKIGFSKEFLPLYNAILFNYAELGKAYLDDKLDEHTIEKFLNTPTNRYESVPQKWVSDVNRILFFLELDQKYRISQLSYQSVEIVANASKSSSILNQIKDYVVRNKAKLILIDNGAVKINDGLYAIEKALEYKESAARKNVSERAQELRLAKERLDTFRETIENILNNAFPDNRKRDYLQKVYNRYFLESSVVNSIAFEVTKNLVEYIKRPSAQWRAIASQIGTESYKAEHSAELRACIKGYFERAFNTTLTPIFEKWLNTHYADKDVDFNNDILPLAIKLGDDIKNEWHELIKSTPVLSALCPSAFDTKAGLNQKIDKNVTFDRHQIQNGTIEVTSSMAIAEIVNQVIPPIISTTVGIIVFHILDFLCLGGFFSWFYSIYIGGLTLLGLGSPQEINEPNDLNKNGKRLYEQIRSNLYDVLLNPDVKESLCYDTNGLSNVIDEDVKMYYDFYRKEIEKKIQEFGKNVSNAEEEYEKTKEKLDRIAKEAYDIRTKEVIPLRERVAEFTNNLFL